MAIKSKLLIFFMFHLLFLVYVILYENIYDISPRRMFLKKNKFWTRRVGSSAGACSARQGLSDPTLFQSTAELQGLSCILTQPQVWFRKFDCTDSSVTSVSLSSGCTTDSLLSWSESLSSSLSFVS